MAHGSLSTLNILVTSTNWVYITDFASHLKPTNLPLHDPDDFYYFFDSGGVFRVYSGLILHSMNITIEIWSRGWKRRVLRCPGALL